MCKVMNFILKKQTLCFFFVFFADFVYFGVFFDGFGSNKSETENAGFVLLRSLGIKPIQLLFLVFYGFDFVFSIIISKFADVK